MQCSTLAQKLHKVQNNMGKYKKPGERGNGELHNVWLTDHIMLEPFIPFSLSICVLSGNC